MKGSGQPMARRVASSRVTMRIVPMVTSSRLGLPTRKASSSKIHGTYMADTTPPIRKAQSRSGSPSGFSTDERVRFGLGTTGKGEDGKDQPQREGKVDAPVGGLLQDAETGGVVVEAGQQEQRQRGGVENRPGERAEADFAVELLFQRLLFGFRKRSRHFSRFGRVRFGSTLALWPGFVTCSHIFPPSEKRPEQNAPTASQSSRSIRADRLPCRSVPHRDGAGCRCRPAPFRR